MEDDTKLTVAAAVAGGYLLGRTKKTRLALTTVTFLLGRRFGLEPKQLVTEGARRLAEVPQVAELQEQIRTEGLEAVRKALTSVADRGLDTVTGAVGSRVPGAGGEEDEPPEEPEEDETDEDELPEDEAEEEDEEPAQPPARRRAPAKRARGPEPPGKPAPARKPAKKAAKKPPPEKPEADRPARKKAAPARKSTARTRESRRRRPDHGS
ncbi:histone protein [Streptomyces sp. NPDC047002]|uniref:histone protein n=1 Tax=Streptomyces sp. NPDC047002 TaxID=3155475 RepID=UPI003453F100